MQNSPALHKSPFPATPDTRKLVVSSGFLGNPPMSDRPAASQPHAIPLPYPAIEELPEFVGNIDSSQLQPAARHYNGSICEFCGHIYLAYRYETFDAVSHIGICELDKEFRVIGDKRAAIPHEIATHFEDPRLVVVGGRLLLNFAHVKLGVPPLCRQRIMVVGMADAPEFNNINPTEEVSVPFGNIGGIEKNWAPFELLNRGIGLVYSQKPRLVIDVETQAGAWSQQICRVPAQGTLSGRTPPIRIDADHYLEFVGGHIPFQARAARYWFGAQLFQVEKPHRVVKATKEPLVWGTEASLTIHSPRPYAGHPCCIFPAGVLKEGEYVIVSCGVNDSYIALLRFHIPTLLKSMEAIT